MQHQPFRFQAFWSSHWVVATLSLKKKKKKKKYLVHAGSVESHDGAMGEPLKDPPEGAASVGRLGLEDLVNEPPVEHDGQNVIADWKK